MYKKMVKHLENLVSLQKQMLNALQNMTPITTEEVWLDSTDVKQILKISDPTLYRLRKNNVLSTRKIGGKWYYSKSALLQLLRGNWD